MIRKLMAGALRRAADAVAPDETDWNDVVQWAVGLAAVLGAEVGAIYLHQHHERIAALERREREGEADRAARLSALDALEANAALRAADVGTIYGRISAISTRLDGLRVDVDHLQINPSHVPSIASDHSPAQEEARLDAQAAALDALRADVIRTGSLVVELTRDRAFLRAHLARLGALPPDAGPERFHAWRIDRICCDGPRRQALVVDGKARHPRSTWCAVCKAQADGPGMQAEWVRCIFEPSEEGQTWEDEGSGETKAPPVGLIARADEARLSAKREEIARVVTALEAMAVGEWIGWGDDQIERYADGWGPRSNNTDSSNHIAWPAAEVAAHFANNSSLAFDKTRDA